LFPLRSTSSSIGILDFDPAPCISLLWVTVWAFCVAGVVYLFLCTQPRASPTSSLDGETDVKPSFLSFFFLFFIYCFNYLFLDFNPSPCFSLLWFTVWAFCVAVVFYLFLCTQPMASPTSSLDGETYVKPSFLSFFLIIIINCIN